jgi:hypothetical protein
VRRGRDGGTILQVVQFADERENMLLHIFVWKRRQSPKRPAIKRSGRPRKLSGVEDIIGEASAVAERMPVMPQTLLLRPELSPAWESKLALAGGTN